MATSIDSFWKGLECVVSDPTDLEGCLRASQQVLSPWAAWLLIGLLRYRERQLWAVEIVKDRLNGDPQFLPHNGMFELPRSGFVPGMIDFSYDFDGHIWRLTNRLTGELIEFNFHDHSGEYIDIWSYREHLKSLKSPDVAESRLIQLHPSVETISLTVDDLRSTSFIVPFTGSQAFRLAKDAIMHGDAVNAFCELWSQLMHRPTAAVAIGDWLAAMDADAGFTFDDHSRARIKECACRARTIRVRSLLARTKDRILSEDALTALVEVGTPNLTWIIKSTLRGEPNRRMIRALELIAEDPDDAWLPLVFQLFRRFDSRHAITEPRIWSACARILLRRRHKEREVVAALLHAKGAELGEAAILALEHAPQFARLLFQRALRSSRPDVQLTAAAALAILDEPWGRTELVQVLRDSRDPGATDNIRDAMDRSMCAVTRKEVEVWEAVHLPNGPSDRWREYREIMLTLNGARIRHEMDILHDRVLPLRGRVQ